MASKCGLSLVEDAQSLIEELKKKNEEDEEAVDIHATRLQAEERYIFFLFVCFVIC